MLDPMSDKTSQNRPASRRAEHFLKPCQRSTPCVGVCSTSHGDFVCRGCKRFFNEVRDWQSFEVAQRKMVLERLGQLKRDSVYAVVPVADLALLTTKTDAYVSLEDDDLALRIYEALARCEGDYASWGLERPRDVPDYQDPLSVLKYIEDHFYDASRGTFEQMYKIRAN